jgi:hypothetical protein
LKYSTKELEQLVDVAKASAHPNNIDWDSINITEDALYRTFAATVLEMDRDPVVQQSIILNLLIENFELKLEQMRQK